MTKIMLDSALSNIAGPLADFAQKLSGPDGNIKWLPAFKRFLRQENPWDGQPLFAPWKRIMIPQLEHREQIESLAHSYCLVDRAERILRHAAHDVTGPYHVEFVRVTPANLGLPNGADHYRDILRRLKFVGLYPCLPHEVAELRRHFDEQAFVPMSEGYIEALMEPVMTGDGELALELNHDEDDGNLQLTGFNIEDNSPGPNSPYVCVSTRYQMSGAVLLP